MALTFISHWNERDGVVNEVFAAAREAELNRQKEYDAAVLIQAAIRGVRLRQFVKYLHMCATRIQMAWRGYEGRLQYHRQLAAKVEERQLNYYHTMATKIKKVWKGHYVRKNVYDYYAMKTYLTALEEKNAIVRAKLAEYASEMAEREELERELEDLERYNKYARSCHYMISTQVKPGVFAKPDEEPVFEEQIKAVFPGNLSKKRNTWHQIQDTAATTSQQIQDTAATTGQLPPLKRIQGPFKNPTAVYLQRFKPLKPTLKVQTNFTSEETAKEVEKQEEWCKRVIDEKFSPFTRLQYDYIPSLHNNTKHQTVEYGTKTFRNTETTDSFVVPQEFKTVFKNIPEFDKFGEAYS